MLNFVVALKFKDDTEYAITIHTHECSNLWYVLNVERYVEPCKVEFILYASSKKKANEIAFNWNEGYKANKKLHFFM